MNDWFVSLPSPSARIYPTLGLFGVKMVGKVARMGELLPFEAVGALRPHS